MLPLKQQFQYMNHNNNIDAISPTQSPQTISQQYSASLDQKKLKTKKLQNNSIPTIPEQRHDESNSQFLELQPEMMENLKKIEQSKKSNDIKNGGKKQSHKQNNNVSISRKQNSTIKSKLNKSVEENNDKKGKMYLRRQQQDRLKQENIKKQFINKLKKWSKQKEEIDKKKVYIQQKKQFLSQELQSKKLKEKEEEEQFIKLEKRKQIQQKIQQIEERRRKRQESLKNAVLRRSYNGVPKYLEYEEKFNAQQQEETLVNLKLMKNKKQKMTLDPQQLKAHEKAYIQRIKQRLNMNNKKPSKKDNQSQQRRTNSDFNLYLKRSEELKKVQLQKIIRRKKFQEKISKIPIKIDDQKKNEILISKDKAKNPQKYHILSQKALNDQQIYSQFKDFNINLDPKQLGDDYLEQLKSSPKKIRSRSRSQVIIKNAAAQPQPFKLPVVQKYQTNHQSKSVKNLALPQIKHKIVIPKSESRSYEQSLKLKKQKDSKYMKQLQKKLAFLD